MRYQEMTSGYAILPPGNKGWCAICKKEFTAAQAEQHRRCDPTDQYFHLVEVWIKRFK